MLLMKSLMRFYREPENLRALLELTSGTRISLRTLVYFVTTYARERAVVLRSRFGGEDVYVNVHMSYQVRLDQYKKIRFDAFRRHQRLHFKYDPANPSRFLETTVGQLNFFRWAIETGVARYAVENVDAIEAVMREVGEKPKSRPREEPPRMTTSTRETVLKFD